MTDRTACLGALHHNILPQNFPPEKLDQTKLVPILHVVFKFVKVHSRGFRRGGGPRRICQVVPHFHPLPNIDFVIHRDFCWKVCVNGPRLRIGTSSL